MRTRRRARLRLPPVRNVLLVAIGGALGAVIRVALDNSLPTARGDWPWTTLAVNLSGAFLLGLLLTVVTGSLAGGTWARPLLGTGVLGAYTTFSTLSLEIDRLTAQRSLGVAGAYALITLVSGLVAVWAGTVLASWFLSLRLGRGFR